MKTKYKPDERGPITHSFPALIPSPTIFCILYDLSGSGNQSRSDDIEVSLSSCSLENCPLNIIEKKDNAPFKLKNLPDVYLHSSKLYHEQFSVTLFPSSMIFF